MATQKPSGLDLTEKDITKLSSIGTAFAAIAFGVLVNDPVVSERIRNTDFEKR